MRRHLQEFGDHGRPNTGLRLDPCLYDFDRHDCAVTHSFETARNAFTLLETVFALAISLILFGALMVSLDMYRRLSTAGREEVRQAQVARAILRMMEVDIRSCVFRPPDQPSSDGSNERSQASEDDRLVTAVNAAEGYASDTGGIVGDSETLIVHVARPTRDLTTLVRPEAEALVAAPGEQQSIGYFLAVRGVDGLSGAAANMIAETETADTVGLARLRLDRLAMQFAESTADLETMAAHTSLLAEEVSTLRFRYFDGLDWYDVWDSTEYGQLPNAIEMQIGLRWQESEQRGNGDDAIRLLRHVVWIPTAEPAGLAAEP